ncbi:MAG: hypothetical protein J6P46_05070 [Bacteroidales bacterium]|nr:hypothetical protein [Bacteroidales bacterium]
MTDLILSQYKEYLPVYTEMGRVLTEKITGMLADTAMVVASVEHRVKSEESLTGKLALKGYKYKDIFDITDIIGIRVITFYVDDVDKTASLLEKCFEIDWANSIDKRKAHEIDSFGYLSLHYICRVPESMYKDEAHPEVNRIRFEVQIRTILQHAWANINHDTGYKSGFEVPQRYMRQLSRLAGMLELVDDEFSRIRTELSDYRWRIRSLVASGNLDDVPLDGDSFRNYLETKPFEQLNRRIAALNQAEIMEVPLSNFLPLLKGMDFKTLGDVSRMIKEDSEAAFQLSRHQIALSDIDIISSSIGLQNLCLARILKSGSGLPGVRFLLDNLNGATESNEALAEFIFNEAKVLPFMNQKNG